jgi:transcriptional regulator with XRE-family HTH domain
MASINHKILSAFARNLRRIRKEKGMSLRDLDAKSGVDHARIGRLERGNENVTLETVAILADALGVNYLDLLAP